MRSWLAEVLVFSILVHKAMKIRHILRFDLSKMRMRWWEQVGRGWENVMRKTLTCRKPRKRLCQWKVVRRSLLIHGCLPSS